VAGTAFAAPISRAYDDPTPQQDEDSMVSNIFIGKIQKILKFLLNSVWILVQEGLVTLENGKNQIFSSQSFMNGYRNFPVSHIQTMDFLK
jgi:hypothetical protein